MKTKQKNKTLAIHIVKVLLLLLSSIFIGFIIISIGVAGRSVIMRTFGELDATSKANGSQIQAIMDTTITIGKNLVSEIQESFENNRSSDSKNVSVVYPDLKLTNEEKSLEDTLISTAKNAVEYNDAVIGIGIMFNPYIFSKNRESYALYFTAEDDGSGIGVSDVGKYEDYSAEGYFQIALDQTNTIFTSPYTYREMWMITGATPIIVDGKLIGVINVDVSMSEFSKLNLKNDSYPSMTVTLSNSEGLISFDSSNEDFIGKNMTDVIYKVSSDFSSTSEEMKKGKAFRNSFKGKSGTVFSFYSPLAAGVETWHTITSVSAKDVYQSIVILIIILIILTFVALGICFLIVTKVVNKNLRPIQSVVQAAEQIAEGNLDISLTSTSEDELGQLAKTFGATCTWLKSIIGEISEVLEQIAENNFNIELIGSYKGEFAAIQSSLMNIVANLNTMVKNIKDSSNRVTASSSSMSETSYNIAEGAKEQMKVVEELQDNIRTVLNQVDMNTGHVKEASDLVQEAGQELVQSNDQMENMMLAMEDISESSKQIEEIIRSIEDIASQTNLLSLNASIEAARAGEAGRGFAVVADEIRQLAEQSGEAAQNTRNLIGNSLNAVDKGTQIAKMTEEMMQKVTEKIDQVVSDIANIADESEYQRRLLSNFGHDVNQITEVVEHNSAISEESAATSEELDSQAQILNEIVSKFKLKE